MNADDGGREQALALYDEGRAAMARGDLHTAAAKLRESVARSPAAPSIAALGESLLGLSRYAEAVVHLAAALELGAGGDGAFLRVLLASALDQAGDREQALRQARRALERHPTDPLARAELQRLLSDPRAIARNANRHRLLHELRMNVPALRFDPGAPPVEVLRSIGAYVALCLELGCEGDDLDARVEPVFRFLNRLAVSPDPEVVDLLVGTVFPVLARSAAATALARRGLFGKGRAAFDDALALWGAPPAGPRPLTPEIALEGLRLFVVSDFHHEDAWTLEETAAAFGKHLVARIVAGAPDQELVDPFRLLSLLGASSGEEGAEHVAFEAALGEILESGQRRALDAASRLLIGRARSTFERLR